MHTNIHPTYIELTYNILTRGHTYTQTHIHTYLPTYIHTYTHTYIHTYINTHTHTYKHAYQHTYNIHTTYIQHIRQKDKKLDLYYYYRYSFCEDIFYNGATYMLLNLINRALALQQRNLCVAKFVSQKYSY